MTVSVFPSAGSRAARSLFLVLGLVAGTALAGSDQPANDADPMVQKAIEEAIRPVGQVNVGSVPAPAPAAESAAVDGASVYQSSCFACHGTGAAGAPKIGDKAAWKPRIAQGMDTLFKHATEGFKGMPPRGGNASLSDEAVRAAIEHMVSKSR